MPEMTMNEQINEITRQLWALAEEALKTYGYPSTMTAFANIAAKVTHDAGHQIEKNIHEAAPEMRERGYGVDTEATANGVWTRAFNSFLAYYEEVCRTQREASRATKQ